MADDLDRRGQGEPPAAGGIDSLDDVSERFTQPKMELFEANGTFSVRPEKERHDAAQYTMCASWHFCVLPAIYGMAAKNQFIPTLALDFDSSQQTALLIRFLCTQFR